ncbi:MAG: glycosyltransferase [Anaerolineae bacterium]|nr:glycosyltransferase [Anaerolineae bacterium]MDW8173286.1 glycosyltransferase [Anaerolineae bacterium]
MTLRRLAIISVHASPLAPFGGKKTGGMNVYVRELAQELARRGIEVDIFTRRSSEDEPEVDERLGSGIRVVYLTAGGVRPLSPDELYPHLSEFTAKLIAFATMRSLRYDMVYSHYWLSGWVAQKLKEAWNVPFVQMFHTLGQMKRRLQTSDALLPDQRISTETQIVEWADRIIAATPAEHAQLLWLYRAKRCKIDIVPPGVNTARFTPLSQEEAKARLGFEACHVLLFVGRLEPLKAVDSVLKALAHIRDVAPRLLDSLCFVVVGGDLESDDAEMLRLRRLTDELNLREVVKFMGAREPHELPLFYAAASAVVMPSDYESFGMVALEAMASGRPVIASRVGGLAFVVRDSETGYTVPVRDSQALAEKIIVLLNDASQRQAMGLRASQLALEYAWSNIADRLLAIFNDVQGQRVSRRKH